MLTVTTVLLDLDDTLLGNPMSRFLPAYFAALEQRLSHFMVGRDLRQMMHASVQVLQANQNPQVSNIEAFMADFVRRVGVPAEDIQQALLLFYKEDYPHLRQYTARRPEAREVVQYLLNKGLKVVIATNPLFPATAIEQRLAWAGIDHLAYTLVTTMENSHFSKPNPRYYQEILAKVDSLPEFTWMVGDDPKNDIIPAHQLGLKTWWVADAAQNNPQPSYCTKKGTLAEFLTWLKSGGLL